MIVGSVLALILVSASWSVIWLYVASIIYGHIGFFWNKPCVRKTVKRLSNVQVDYVKHFPFDHYYIDVFK